jgi:hypothetical protein
MHKNYAVPRYVSFSVRLLPSLLKVLSSPEGSILRNTFNMCSGFTFGDENYTHENNKQIINIQKFSFFLHENTRPLYCNQHGKWKYSVVFLLLVAGLLPRRSGSIPEFVVD